MGIEDDYLAFCFDEACLYIEQQLLKDNGPKPKWVTGVEEVDLPDNNQQLIEYLKEQHQM